MQGEDQERRLGNITLYVYTSQQLIDDAKRDILDIDVTQPNIKSSITHKVII